MTFASAPAQPVSTITLEDVLIHSSKLIEELGSQVRAAARIESTLTGYPPAPSGDSQAEPLPMGLINGLHENLCELSQKIGALNSVLGNIEDRLMERKIVNALVPYPPPHPVPSDSLGLRRR